MESSVLTSKGQIVIPENLRKKYGIEPGTRVVFLEKEGELRIRALTKDYFNSLAGWLKGKDDFMDELLKEKKREIEHDKNRSL